MSAPRLVRPDEKPSTLLNDFGDADSQRVLSDTARALARELGRQAAREFFTEITRGANDANC